MCLCPQMKKKMFFFFIVNNRLVVKFLMIHTHTLKRPFRLDLFLGRVCLSLSVSFITGIGRLIFENFFSECMVPCVCTSKKNFYEFIYEQSRLFLMVLCFQFDSTFVTRAKHFICNIYYTPIAP